MDDVDGWLAAAAADLNVRRIAPEIEVLVDIRWHGLYRYQGLCAYNLWTDVFEPVRRRWPWARTWKLLQSPDQAARNIEWFLVERPDLAADQRPADGERQ